MREKKARVSARFERRSGVLLNRPVTHPYVVFTAKPSASVDIETMYERFQKLKKVAGAAPSHETAKKQSRQATHPIYYEKASDITATPKRQKVTLTPNPDYLSRAP